MNTLWFHNPPMYTEIKERVAPPSAVDVGGWYITLSDVRYIDGREGQMATVHFGGSAGYAGFDCVDVVGDAEVYALLAAYRAYHGMAPLAEPDAESVPEISPDQSRDVGVLRERLAAYAHEAWSGWMTYLFSKSSLNGDNSVTIPPQSVERWTRQMHHTYEALPEEEKASDRTEADKMLAIVGLLPDEPEGAPV